MKIFLIVLVLSFILSWTLFSVLNDENFKEDKSDEEKEEEVEENHEI